jgi:two-component system, OmpR family, KDP operon response regulator KdpE
MEHKLIVIGSGAHSGVGRLGYEVIRAITLPEAIPVVLAGALDGIILLTGVPNIDEQCAVLRAMTNLPLIVTEESTTLTPRGAAACYDAGADVVVQSPFTPDDLDAQIRHLLSRIERHSDASSTSRLVIGDLIIDIGAHTVTRRGKSIELSPTEFKLICALAELQGRPVPARELLERVWGPAYADDVHYVRLYISYLRNKLEPDPQRPTLLLSQWGVGYRLVAAA